MNEENLPEDSLASGDMTLYQSRWEGAVRESSSLGPRLGERFGPFHLISEIGRGDLLHAGNIRSIRAPVNAGGVATRHYREVIGSRAGVSLQKHCPLKWEEIERS